MRAFIVLAVAAAILTTSAAAAQAAPPAPTGLRVVATTASTATIAWNPSTGATSYRVLELEYDFDAGRYREALRATVTSPTATLENLMPNSSHNVLVRAVDGAGGVSPASAFLFVSTPPDTEGPTTPGNPRTTQVSFTTATLTWEPSTDNHFLMGYWLSVDGGTPEYRGDATSATVRRLDPGRSHTVAVSARDSLGNFSRSASVTFTTLVDNEAPTAPTNLRGNKVILSWDASRDNSGETNYVVFVDGRQTQAASGFDKTSIQFTEFGRGVFPAEPGSHTVTVRARDRAGNLSPPSNAITVVV